MANHKFIIHDDIKNRLDNEDYIVLTQLGLPYRILSNTFVYNKDIFIEDDCLILGFNSHVPFWFLKVSLLDRSIFFSGKGNYSEEVYSFYNTSLKNLHLCLFSYEFFICRLQKTNLLGNYHQNYKKYGDLLFDLISDIDIEATKRGVWCDLINEMKIGTI